MASIPSSPAARLTLILILAGMGLAHGGELRFAGALGNSHGAEPVFAGPPAPGMGPVVDEAGAIWERGGGARLVRYAPDGRMLAAFDLPQSTSREDQLTRAGGLLVMKIGCGLFTLPIDAPAGTAVRKLESSADTLSASSHDGRVVVWEKGAGELAWLDPVTGTRTALMKPGGDVQNLDLGEDGTLFGFANGQVRAWREGQLLPGYPKEFRGERPQRVGSHWYSHSWHGTLNRLNEAFEPDPGVVLGGASGSFIGYLPQSADLTNGRGVAGLDGGALAVSGLGGVVQFLAWNADEQRFTVARRLGGLTGLTGVALDASGNLWTPRGGWRWTDTAEAPHRIGDKEPEITAQPVVLNGRSLCLLKKHYSYVQLAHGPLIDADGWSRLETQGVPDFELSADVTGAAAVTEGDSRRLVFATHSGRAFMLGIGADGQLAGKPASITLPGLTGCTSLAWCAGRLHAAVPGAVIAYAPSAGNAWSEISRETKWGSGDLHIHSDGQRLAVSDKDGGQLRLFDADLTPLAVYSGLLAPGVVAVSGDRVAVYEAGRQRLVRLEFQSAPSSPSTVVAQPLPSVQSRPTAHLDADFLDWQRPVGMPLACALTVEPGRTPTVSLRTRPGAEVQVGIANATDAWTASEEQATHADGQWNWVLPAGDWSQVRLAVAVTLPGQRERFGFTDAQPIHAPFNPDPAAWASLDLESHREQVNTRRQEIRLAFEQPLDGKATLVIEDERGHRVRNLVSGRAYPAGRHTVVWDGLDEQGNLVKPGVYRWRGITHPGLKPDYRMNFANGDEPTTEPWGPNHSTLRDATGNGKLVFMAAPVTEGGWGLVALDADGRLVQGYEQQHGLGIQHNAIAADDRFLYCAQDGFAWGGHKGADPSKPDWKAPWTVTVVRYDITSGKLVDFPGKRHALEVDTIEVGSGSAHPNLEDFNLGGLAVHDGMLFVACRDKKEIHVLDATTGERAHIIALADVRLLTAGAHGVLAITGAGVVRLRDMKLLVLTGNMRLTGLAVAANGDLWVSDATSHQVHRYDPEGNRLDTLGLPGGPYRGAYVPEHLVNPRGIALGPDGKLWVTEDRWNPKRVLAWDVAAKRVVVEKFGMPHYGGDGSGFDPEDPTRWIGLGCFWKVDLAARTARPTHVLSREEGHLGGYQPHGYQFFREAGRTFVCTRGKIALIAEVLADGTLRDVAATAGTHHFAYAFDWDPPQAYIDAFYAKWPAKRAGEKPGRKGEGKPWSQRGMGVLWVDRNGDGAPQAEEFDFCGDQLDYAGGPWGHLQHSLTLTLPVADKTGVRVLNLPPRGFLPNGVPNYPSLDEALALATPISLTPGYKRSGVATVRDRFGRLLFNSDPEMNAYAADGTHLWSFANRWSDVHGSHDAPLPAPGVMQGNLAFLGRAGFDDQGDVVFLNGNHGRCFLLTTDGLYLDEAFVDVRVSYQKNEYRLGGEIFGGSFARDEAARRYYVQIGHGPYRVYEITGFDRASRMDGKVEVTAAQIAAAESRHRRVQAETHQAKTATLPGTVKWTRDGRFPVEVRLDADTTELRLHYRVQDPSPWVNQGRDWTKLFATGDTVDFQFATDPTADPRRRGPVPGDKRLMIAPFEGGPVAVLFEHRKPGGANPVTFTSPWRGEKVDNVTRLTDVKIEVKVGEGGYEVDASIPLASLGLALPPGRSLAADFGVTYGDAAGTDTNLRSHWSNPSTALVDDIPGEIMLSPQGWGRVEVRARPE